MAFNWQTVFVCAAILALIAAYQTASHHQGVLLAIAPVAVAPLKEKRAELVKKAEALHKDGTFADDAARAAFDGHMTEVRQLDEQIRQAEAVPAPTAGQTDVERRATETERARVIGIQDAVRIAGLDAPIAADMVTRGITLDAARGEIFAKMAEKSNENPTRSILPVGEDAKDKQQRGALNWLLHRAGVAKDVAKAEGVDVRTIDPGEFRGMTLPDLARHFLERAGRSVRASIGCASSATRSRSAMPRSRSATSRRCSRTC
jgi:hypothetical protein